METDSFFYQLLKQLPQTLFELLDLPAEWARAYRFNSVELKKSLRIDGLFRPTKPNLPLYFVEVQFQPSAKFYANLFGKVFWYLEENDPAQDWLAVAVFPNRSLEPKHLRPYEELLHPQRVKRIFLDEHPIPADPPPGLGILQLVSAPEIQVKDLVHRLLYKAKSEFVDGELGRKMIELVEELLVRRFSKLNREEIRAMFQLESLRNTRVWQEIHEEGIDEGIEKGRVEGKTLAKKELVGKWLAKGMSAQAIAELMEISVREVRRLAKDVSK